MNGKAQNQMGWLFVLPVLGLVAFNAIIPLMAVVNYSVQETFGCASVLEVPSTNEQLAPESGSFAPPDCGVTVHEYDAIPLSSDEPEPSRAIDAPSAPE